MENMELYSDLSQVGGDEDAGAVKDLLAPAARLEPCVVCPPVH